MLYTLLFSCIKISESTPVDGLIVKINVSSSINAKLTFSFKEESSQFQLNSATGYFNYKKTNCDIMYIINL